MRLPQMNDKSIMRPTVLSNFGGINHNRNAGDGELYDMKNLSSREYPLLSPRNRRGYVQTISKAQGIGAQDEPWWVSGTGFYYNGERKGTVEQSRKQFAAMGSKIIIFPDKKVYDAEADTFTDLEVGKYYTNLQFQNGTYGGIPATANTIYCAGAEWEYEPGDAIVISGCTVHPGNNLSAIVREVSGDYLRFYENTFYMDGDLTYTVDEDGLEAGTYYTYYDNVRFHFTLPALSEGDTLTYSNNTLTLDQSGTTSTITTVEGIEGYYLEFTITPQNYTETGTVKVAREVPDLDYICVNDNRLWGCKGDTIYASKLGDPANFYVYDGLSTDSWTSETVDAGDFTGCVSFQGYPIFFKPESICKVQGDKPSNFQWTISSKLGVKEGCYRSIAVAGDTLFYLSRAGICAYGGGQPSVISDGLGANTKWDDAAAGTDSIRYYVSMTDGDDYSLYVFDTRYGTWHREDNTHATDFAFWDEGLYMLKDDGGLYRIDGTEGTEESSLDWYAEFGDTVRFYETSDTHSQNKKGLLRFQIRCELEAGSTITVYVQYDDDDWQQAAVITGEASKFSYNIPLILRRCDHFRLKLVGSGEAVVYSITEVKYAGSNLQGGTLTSIGE